jgi:hypothetical protein
METLEKTRGLKVFILEDDKPNQERITKDFQGMDYNISFFSKNESIFDLLKFYPDILIKDYKKNKVLKYEEWPAY